MTEYRTKADAHQAGVTEGIRQATEAMRLSTNIMDPARMASAVTRMAEANSPEVASRVTHRFSAGDLMVGSPTPMEFAVELARHYNAEPA